MDYLNIHGPLYTEILQGILSEAPDSIPQCYYVVGRRGYGKTGLLRNLAKTLSESAGYLPRYVDCLMSPSFDIREAILEYNDSESRLVLLLDDMDVLLDNMERDEMFVIRSLLYEKGAPVIVGAGAELSDEFTEYQAPFYDAFILHHLKELSRDASIDLFARMRGETRLRKIDASSKFVSDLFDEIGRTPESCRLLSGVISFDGGRAKVLSEALSPLSLYFRGKIMALSPSQRKTLVFMLSQKDPVLLKDIREATGQTAGDVSPQLKALGAKGLVLATRPSVKKTEYAVADKTMNAWFRNCVVKDQFELI